MATKSAGLVVVCVAVLLAGFAAATGSRDELPVASGSPVTPFHERVAAYAELRRQIVADLLNNGIDPHAEDHGREFRTRLGLAIRDARRDAQPGEVFGVQLA